MQPGKEVQRDVEEEGRGGCLADERQLRPARGASESCGGAGERRGCEGSSGMRCGAREMVRDRARLSLAARGGDWDERRLVAG
jgi:hypothetical protein